MRRYSSDVVGAGGCPLRALAYAVAGIRYGGVAGLTIKTIEDPVHHDDLAVGSSFI